MPSDVEAKSPMLGGLDFQRQGVSKTTNPSENRDPSLKRHQQKDENGR